MIAVRSAVASILGAVARSNSSRFLSVGGAGLCLTAASLAFGGLAHAQEAEPAASATEPAASTAAPAASAAALEEVTVTGSRIRRRDLEAFSPIVTVGDQAFTESSTVAIESVLNELPQFQPGASQFTTGDIFPSATNTPGISTINLRGLGTNRTLVLIDGRRGQPANSTLVVDTNTIPSAMLESVEIISGGASAVYGADALAGVVNFKLKDNFEGVSIDARTGITERGDGQESRLATLFGANLGDGRGNAMVSLEWTKREEVLQRDRDFYSRAYTDPNSSALAAIRINTFKFQPERGGLPSQSVANDLFPERPAGVDVGLTTPFYFNPDGSLYKDTGALGFQGQIGDGRYRLLPNGVLGENYTDGRISSPLQRYSLFGKADYDINDRVKVFAQTTFVRTKVDSVNQVTGVDGGFSASIPYGDGLYGPSVDINGNTLPEYQEGGIYGLKCPPVGGCTKSQAFPVPPELAALLSSRGPNQYTTATVTQPVFDPTTGEMVAQLGVDSDWSLGGTTFFLPGRRLENTTNLYQLLAGATGDLGLSDWTWEVYGSHGETETDNNYNNYVSYRRYQELVQSPNYGKGYTVDGVGSTSASCQSGLPVFESFKVSDDCIAAITASFTDRTQLSQDIVEANVQGKLIDLPAGELRSAFGLTYRKNQFTYKPDASREVNSIIDIPAGSFGQSNVFGSTDVREAYAEFLVPLLRDKPFVQSLELELGYRYSDYNTAGGTPTYKGLVSWAPNGYVRLRGGYQLATRAPNINELFLGESTNPVVTRGPDPCRADTRDFNGNLPSNPNRVQVQALCSALIGTGTSTFDADPDNFRGDGRTDGGELEIRSGNINLDNEEGKTYTLGLILSSPFEHAALRGLTLALDWYSIELKDAISFISAQTTYDLCFNRDGISNPTYSIDDPNGVCRNIVRDPETGNRLFVNSPYANLGTVETSGLDIQLSWRAMLEDIGLPRMPGSLALDISVNKLFEYEAQDFPTQPARSNKGTLAGPAGANGYFDYRAVTNLRYFVGEGYVGLGWRRLPSVRSATYVTDPTTTTLGAASYNIFDLAGSYSFSKNVKLTAGIDNLFDKEPNIVGANQTVNRTDGTTTQVNGAGSTLPNYYDALGRRYYAGVKVTF